MELSIEHRLTDVEAQTKDNTRRIDDVERRQDNLDELVSTVKVLAVREETVEKDVKEIKQDVKAINEKPVKRWDSIVEKIIWFVIAAILGFLASKFGL